MEDNLPSADPLSYTTTIMIPGRPSKLSERLLTCKNPLHSFLWSPTNIGQTVELINDHPLEAKCSIKSKIDISLNFMSKVN